MSRQASTWLDPVVGLDLHLQIVLRPPLPPFVFLFPHPFVGLVFDPIGLIVGMVVSNVMGAVTGSAPFALGPVLINNLPATTAGTNAMGLPVLHWPYMGAWVPFPRIRPPIRPTDLVKPDLPIPPNDSIIITGSDSVYAMGASLSRTGDVGLSCSDPVRLPLSFIIAIPKGPPVLAGGGTTIDFVSAAIGVLSSRFITTPIRRWLGGRLRGVWQSPAFSRLRNLWDDVRCFFTGHPVDVATGRLATRAVDFQVRGAVSIELVRSYSSCWADRPSAVGRGWSHSFEESAWLEWGKVVYRTGEGREIEIAIPGGRGALAHDVPVPDRANGITLVLRKTGEIALLFPGGVTRTFERTSESTWRLRAIETPDGVLSLRHDARGRLEKVTDGAGREVLFVHDEEGRLSEVWLPSPDGASKVRRSRYRYSETGDLIEVEDALGHVTRYEYVEHLLVRETDREGRSFYFGYDGRGPEASCVRTWGDGGVFDHEIVYDRKNRATHVTDSVGGLRSYRYDERSLVTGLCDTGGRWTKLDYDQDGLLTGVEDPDGHRQTREYDESGHLRRVTYPDGTTEEVELDQAGRVTRMTDRSGRTAVCARDARGAIVEMSGTGGQHLRFERDRRGQVIGILSRGERVVRAERDARGLPARIQVRSRPAKELVHDHLGRLVAAILPVQGGSVRREYEHDALDRLVRVREGDAWITFEYNREGDRTRTAHSGGGEVVHTPAGPGWPAARTLGRKTWQFERDTEGRLTGVVSPGGERHALRRDFEGRLLHHETPDGRDLWFSRDGASLAIRSGRRATRIRRDVRTREVTIERPGGQTEVFEYDPDGRLVRARSGSSSVVLERGPLGQVRCETSEVGRVESDHDGAGRLVSVRSSAGFEIVFGRDANGRVVDVTVRAWGEPPVRLEIERDPTTGAALRKRLPGGVAVEHHHGPNGRLVERIARREGKTLLHQTFRYDGPHLSEVADVLAGKTTSFERVEGEGTDRMVRGGEGEVGRYLDVERRPHRRRDRTGRHYLAGGRLIETEDGARYRYDAAGRLVEREGGRRGTSWLEYDDADRLVRVTDARGRETAFEHDALGRRIRKRGPDGTTEQQWSGARIVAESGPRGKRLFVWDPDGLDLWATLVPGGGVWLETDVFGAPEIGFDDRGEVVYRASTDLWGNVAAERGEGQIPWRFPGQYEDPETGLFYNGHRYYDPESGRYTTPDPAGLAGGLDPYGYVADPLRQCDPQGLTPCWPNSMPLDDALRQIGPNDLLFGYSDDIGRFLGEIDALGRARPRTLPWQEVYLQTHANNKWLLDQIYDRNTFATWPDAVMLYEAQQIDNVFDAGGRVFFLRNPASQYDQMIVPKFHPAAADVEFGKGWSMIFTPWESFFLNDPSLVDYVVNVPFP